MVMNNAEIIFAGSTDGNVYESASTDFGLVAPAKLYPLANTLDVEGSIPLRWRAAVGSSAYHVQISSDSLFASHVVVDQTVPDTFNVVSNLDTVTRFYWRVRSQNQTGTSMY